MKVENPKNCGINLNGPKRQDIGLRKSSKVSYSISNISFQKLLVIHFNLQFVNYDLQNLRHKIIPQDQCCSGLLRSQSKKPSFLEVLFLACLFWWLHSTRRTST